MKNKINISVFTVICVLCPLTALATPTGLNNIPTSDVVPKKVLVLQGIAEVGNDNKPDYFTGFKYGLLENLEVGLDGRIFPESGLEETLTGQMKYRFELTDLDAVAFGVANLGDRAKTGFEDYYLAYSHNFNWVRLHLGGSLQRDNEGGFVGIDKTVKFLGRDWTWRADFKQSNDAHDTISSIGFIYDLGHNVLMESWVSFPTQEGKEEFTTIKINYVFKF